MAFELLSREFTIFNDLINKNSILLYIASEEFDTEHDFFVGEKTDSQFQTAGVVFSTNLENVLHLILKNFERITSKILYLYMFRVKEDIVLNGNEFECLSQSMMHCVEAPSILQFYNSMIPCVKLETSVFSPLATRKPRYVSSMSTHKSNREGIYTQSLKDQVGFLMKSRKDSVICSAVVISVLCNVFDGFHCQFRDKEQPGDKSFVYDEKMGILFIYYIGLDVKLDDLDEYGVSHPIMRKLKSGGIFRILFHQSQYQAVMKTFKLFDIGESEKRIDWDVVESGVRKDLNNQLASGVVVPEDWVYMARSIPIQAPSDSKKNKKPMISLKSMYGFDKRISGDGESTPALKIKTSATVPQMFSSLETKDAQWNKKFDKLKIPRTIEPQRLTIPKNL